MLCLLLPFCWPILDRDVEVYAVCARHSIFPALEKRQQLPIWRPSAQPFPTYKYRFGDRDPAYYMPIGKIIPSREARRMQSPPGEPQHRVD